MCTTNTIEEAAVTSAPITALLPPTPCTRRKDYCLAFMIVCYLVPISLVIYNYQSNPSVSNLICDDTCKNTITCMMVLMGGGALFYERERGDPVSMVIIGVLLVGLVGLIRITESDPTHFIFAYLAFAAIMGFMVRHSYLHRNNWVLWSSLGIEILALLVIAAHMNTNNIFLGEIVYILNFALFYLYLHFYENHRRP